MLRVWRNSWIRRALKRQSPASADVACTPPSRKRWGIRDGRRWPATTLRRPDSGPDQALDIELAIDKPPASVRLYYRHVDQAERFESYEMDGHDNRYRATIPGGLYQFAVSAAILL